MSVSLGALVLFVEHRYFGDSLPIKSNQSHLYPNHRYLSVEQTLEDYAHLIKYVRSGIAKPIEDDDKDEEEEEEEDEEEEAAVIAIGGGYGGMLAAWMRIKFPHVVVGALASSAPLVQAKCDEINRLVSKVYSNVDLKCSQVIGGVWKVLDRVWTLNGGLAKVTRIFGICNGTLGLGQKRAFKSWIELMLRNGALFNYPYAVNGSRPLPKFPVKVLFLF